MRDLRYMIISEMVINIGLFIYLGYCVITGKHFFVLKNPMSKRADIIVKIVAGLLLCRVTWAEWFPLYRDIPNLINRNLCIIEGESQNDCQFNSRNTKGLISFVKDEKTGEVVRVTFKYEKSIKEGDHLVVQYLPHSKRGILLEINGEPYYRKIE